MFKVVFFLIFLFYGCNDNNEDIFTKGTKEFKIDKNIDLNSYKEISKYFKDNNDVIFNQKPVLIIFSANNCKYCDLLKQNIQDNKILQNLIQKDYDSYYINISYNKEHRFNNDIFSTNDLVSKYQIQATPSFVVLTNNAKLVFLFAGFVDSKRLIVTLNLLKDKDIQKLNEDELLKKIFLTYRELNV